MTIPADALCNHCLLPIGPRAMRRMVNGESRAFCCYGCCIAYQVNTGNSEEWEAAWLLIRLGVGAFLSMNIMLFSLLFYAGAFTGSDAQIVLRIQILLWVLATSALLVLGGPFLRESWQNGIHGRLTSSTLIVLGVGGAYIYSALAVLEHAAHVYFDTAAMVLMLFTLGRFLEAAGRARAARDLSPLLAAERECASVVEGGAERPRPVRELSAGMQVRVRPGERIPVDGIVLDGQSQTDEAVITGESQRVAKSAGSSVIAGSLNLDGPLLIETSSPGNETRWAQICRSVRAALSNRTSAQRIADRVAGVFVLMVLALACGTALYWSQRLAFDRALLVGLAVLVVACPCAVGLAAPLATSLGIGRLARRGCLVRDAATLEVLARARLLAFDKTGTLTSGSARLVGIDSEAVTSDEVLARAAGLEFGSEHNLARAVAAAAAARGLEPILARQVRLVPGRGIQGIAGGQRVAAGNKAMMRELGWPLPNSSEHARSLEARGYSVVYLGWDERVQAVLWLDDTPLPAARPTIEALRNLGLHMVLLTGDLAGAARRVATAVGLADWQAGLLPEAKRRALDRRRRGHGVVVMVGDGLNDGPVLAGADVGIAVGSATDLARETADLVLPAGGLWILPWVIGLARATHRTILTNLWWAFGYNSVALTLAALGLLQPIMAAVIMAGSSLLVVVNSLRLERFPDPVPPAVDDRQPSTEAEDRNHLGAALRRVKQYTAHARGLNPTCSSGSDAPISEVPIGKTFSRLRLR
jgi:P-type Cu2+ transporter